MPFLVRQKLPARLRRIYSFNQYEREQWVAAQAAKVPSGSRLLDMGAGSCPYRKFFTHCEYKTHDFVQLKPEQLLGQQGYGQIDYVSDITAVPVPPASFDVILCTEVLEHVPEPIQAVREMGRILKPGGRLILTAPLGSGLHQQPYHFYGGYTPYWYQKFLTEAGFKEISIEPNGSFFKFYGQESWRFASLLAPWRGKGNILWSPFWVLTLPWFAGIVPLLGYFLDGLDTNKHFTIGYHVTAVRSD